MKKLITILSIFILVNQLVAQVPQFFNYQAVARDSLGICTSNQDISLRFTILDSAANGNMVYAEEFRSVRTNNQGLFSVDIGTGIPQPIAGVGTPNFEGLDWSGSHKWLSVGMDPNNGFNFKILGIQQFASIPYAKFAGNVSGEPVGTVKMFWNANGALSIPPGWKIMDGTTVNDTESPLDGVTLPNMTNRYAVGDTGNLGIGSVGNVNHTIDLSHSHTVNSHRHTIPAHTHSPGSLKFRVAVLSGSGTNKDLFFYGSNGLPTSVVETVGVDRDSGTDGVDINDNQTNESYYTDDSGASGSTGSGGGGNTGSASPGTDSQLSSNQSIQPESIGLIYIIKVK